MLCEFVTRQNVCTHFSRDILVTFNKSDRLVGTLILKNVLFEGFDYQKFFFKFFSDPQIYPHTVKERLWPPHTDYSILQELIQNNLFLLLCLQGSASTHWKRKRGNTTHWWQLPQELKCWTATIVSSFDSVYRYLYPHNERQIIWVPHIETHHLMA